MKSAKLTAMSASMTHIVRDETCSSLRGLTKNIVLLYCLTTKFEKLYFKLPTIICVIQGTSQMGLKNNLSLSIGYHSYIFQIKVPGLEVEGCDLGAL